MKTDKGKSIKNPNFTETEKKIYPFLDLIKLFFALMIPLLHIAYTGGLIHSFFQQYVARLGVPFFFAVTGFFLERALAKNTTWPVGIRYIKRASVLLCFWLCIDIPLYLVTSYKLNTFTISDLIGLIQKILFLSPGYLWYLVALVVGEAIYCLARINLRFDLKKIIFITGTFYIVGVLLNSWGSLLNIQPQWYYEIFLTSRNGVFFAPMMIASGALASKRNNMPKWSLIIAIIVFIVEVFFVRSRVESSVDTSLYFSLPFVIYFIINWVINVDVDNKYWPLCLKARKISVLIYCLQYPCFTVIGYLMSQHVGSSVLLLTNYVLLVGCAVLLMFFIKKANSKYLNYLA